MAKRRLGAVSAAPDEAFSIEWSEIGPQGKLPLEIGMRLFPGVTYNVRLVQRPIRFWRQMNLDGSSRIITSKDGQPTKPGLLLRYAINVLDRADGQTKVLEGPEALFVRFRRCHEITGVELGANDGFDLNIQVTGDGAGRKYHVSFDSTKRTPFTDTEKSILREQMMDLPRLYAPC